MGYIIHYDAVCLGLFVMVRIAQYETQGAFGSVRVRNAFVFCIVVGSSVLFFLTVYSKYLSIERQQQQKQLELFELYAREQRKQFENMMFHDEAMRRIRHDLRSNLGALSALVKKGDYEAVEDFCNKMLGDIDIQNRAYTGDPVVDAVLSEKKAMAEALGIMVDYRIMNAPGHNEESFALCTVISNLLQNAIEACYAQGIEKKLSCTLCNINDRFCVTVQNPVARDVLIDGDRLVTTKDDKKNHGIGTVSIKQALDRCGGKIRYTCENGIFSAVALI